MLNSYLFTALTVSGATFTGNTGKWGGAILGSDTVKLSNDVFTGNSAQLVGAVYVQYGQQRVSDCRFADNSATHAGGGLFDDDAARATAAVSSTTLASNQPDNCAPSRAVSGCTVTGGRVPGGRVPGGRRATASRSVPAHHGGHIARLLLRELTGG